MIEEARSSIVSLFRMRSVSLCLLRIFRGSSDFAESQAKIKLHADEFTLRGFKLFLERLCVPPCLGQIGLVPTGHS